MIAKPQKHWLTFPVAGAAYPSNDGRATLTHSYDPERHVVLCGREADSILDDYSFDTTLAPTCPVCAKRLARLS